MAQDPTSVESTADAGPLGSPGAASTPPTVAAIADSLDSLGHRGQVMHSAMRPVVAGGWILGPAFTIQAVAQPREAEEPYKRELMAVDAIPSRSVVVLSAGGVSEAGIWGELLSTRALARGAVGAVIDGAVRDLVGTGRLGFPVFATAVHAADSYGRAEVVSFGEPISCGGVPVSPGDLIAADLDGVVVIPADIADRCLRDASAKLGKEQQARQMLSGDGASVRDTYARYGVL